MASRHGAPLNLRFATLRRADTAQACARLRCEGVCRRSRAAAGRRGPAGNEPSRQRAQCRRIAPLMADLRAAVARARHGAEPGALSRRVAVAEMADRSRRVGLAARRHRGGATASAARP